MLAEIPILLAQQGGGAESTSLVDWWTLGAQVANFLILVVLLRVFLYRRVVRAMDQREKKIASHFEAAEQTQRDAAGHAEQLKREKDELDRTREQMLTEARQQAEEERRKLTQQAREDVRTQAERWREDLDRGKQAFLQEIRDAAGRQVCQIARRALTDLADVELERAMVGVLIRRLGELSSEDRRELAEAAAGEDHGLVVTTAWEFPEGRRAGAVEAVKEFLAHDGDVRFETAPELICGIALRAGGREVSWSVDSYIEGMRRQLAETVEETIAAESDRATIGEGQADVDGQEEQESSNE